MARLTKGTALEDTLTMIFHYDGMGNRIRKDVWHQEPGTGSGMQDRVSDIYVRDAQGNILAVYKEHAGVNGNATIDWLNNEMTNVVAVPELAVFLVNSFGNIGAFSTGVIAQNSTWGAGQLVGKTDGFFLEHSRAMYGHVLDRKLPEAWTYLAANLGGSITDLLMNNNDNHYNTSQLLNAAISDERVGMATLRKLAEESDALIPFLFAALPGEYAMGEDKMVDMDNEARSAHLARVLADLGPEPIGEAYYTAAQQSSLEVFLLAWLGDTELFNINILKSQDDLRKFLKNSVLNAQDAATTGDALRDHMAQWLKVSDSEFLRNNYAQADLLNVVYESDKVVFLENYLNDLGISGVTKSLVEIPGMNSLSYGNIVNNAVSIGLLNPAVLQFLNTPSPQNIETDTLWLAEHHLYGSSRLGIKQYEPGAYRNLYHNGQPFVKGINIRQPWYSHGLQEEIKEAIKIPASTGHYLSDAFRYRRDLGMKYYELSDHLGNVLATVLDRKTGYGSLNGEYTGFKADIASATDYYPFGMEMPGRTVSSEKSRFGFNGQEKDNEMKGNGNSIDFTARMYDTRVGRFLSLDPLSKKFPSESNFSFAGNNPIYYVDREGKYKISADRIASYREKFPHIVAYFENQIHDDIMKSQTIIDGITMHQKFTKNYSPELSKKYVDYITTWGQGPEIIFDEDFGWPLLPGGEFIPENNVIMLRESNALELERILSSDVSSNKKMIAFFRFFKTVVHESGHRANYPGYKVGFDDNTVFRVQDRFNKNSLEAGFDTENFIWGNDKMNPFFTDFSSDANLQMIINNAKQTPEGLTTLPTLPKLPPAAKPNKNENVD